MEKVAAIRGSVALGLPSKETTSQDNANLVCRSIDGLNTSTIGLLDLRRRLAIIPQDAALFEGTIRDNLDPRHVHDDTELWSVLEHARLKEHVSGMEGQLDAAVHEGGKCRPPSAPQEIRNRWHARQKPRMLNLWAIF
jgi:hypothetical protein